MWVVFFSRRADAWTVLMQIKKNNYEYYVDLFTQPKTIILTAADQAWIHRWGNYPSKKANFFFQIVFGGDDDVKF
jgi:ABC-type bacteriocin/lantibiotic exporter with double-glycine peptidase domain